MKLYTNCEKFHCSMLRTLPIENMDIAAHLTITRKPKYPIIARNLDICDSNNRGFDCCSMWLECAANIKTKPASIEEMKQNVRKNRISYSRRKRSM